MENHEKTLSNRAKIENSEKTACANCGERLVFALQDSHGIEFSIGLSVILQCLKKAESEKCVPNLPQEWWRKIMSYYSYSEL